MSQKSCFFCSFVRKFQRTMRKTFFLFIAMCLFCCHAMAQKPSWNSVYQAYIDQYHDMAIEQMMKYKIPASITLAQGLLESGAGRSELARLGNNHFGIKCHDWRGRTMRKDDDLRNECFRVYDNARQSYEDHSKFLTQHRRYARLFQLRITDYQGWARGLKECGYATSPTYAQALINIIELYQLDRYDRATHYDRYVATHSGTEKPATPTQHQYPIYKNNKNYYVKARTGDTFASIGREVGISGHDLAKYNERPYNDRLYDGDIIYLKKKRKHADKEFRDHIHVVRPGESMYLVAQIYGIRLKYLYKINHLSPDYQLKVGDRLRVY